MNASEFPEMTEEQLNPQTPQSFIHYWNHRHDYIKFWDDKNEELKHMATWFRAAYWAQKMYLARIEQLEKDLKSEREFSRRY